MFERLQAIKNGEKKMIGYKFIYISLNNRK